MSSASNGSSATSNGIQTSETETNLITDDLEHSFDFDIPVLTKSQTLEEILNEELTDADGFDWSAVPSESDEVEDGARSEISTVASTVNTRNSDWKRPSRPARSIKSDVLHLRRLKGVSSQLNTADERLGIGCPSALAICNSEERGKHNKAHPTLVAVGTDHACVFVFDASTANQVVRFCIGAMSKEMSAARASQFGRVAALCFNPNGHKLLIGYARGHVQVVDCACGKVTSTLRPDETHQPGKGILHLCFLDPDSSGIVVDSGGSVFKFNIPSSILSSKAIDCVFSGCRGEVVAISALLVPQRLLSPCKHYKEASLLAMATLTKVVVVSLRYRSDNNNMVKFGCPLPGPPNEPPLLCWQWAPIQVSVKLKIVDPVLTFYRKGEIHFYQLHSSDGNVFRPFYLQKISIDYFPISLAWLNARCIVLMDDHEKLHLLDASSEVKKMSSNKTAGLELETLDASSVQIVFSTPDFKGLATGSSVSKALMFLADNTCYQSLITDNNGKIYLLGSKGVHCLSLRSWVERVEDIEKRDIHSAILLANLFYSGKLRVASAPINSLKYRNLIADKIADLVLKLSDRAVGRECPTSGSIQVLQDHYKTVVPICIDSCLSIQREDLLYSKVYERFERDLVARGYFLECLEEYILDNKLNHLPPSIVQDYFRHLDQEGLFGSIESSIVRIPIECLDLHQVMSICKAHDLYDGIIYVHNKALKDYLEPLEDMLEALKLSSLSSDLLSDEQIQVGNKILYYLSSCLCGRRYPVGSLAPGEDKKVSRDVYNFITRIRPKHGVRDGDDCTYPYLRILLKFDTREFLNVLSMAFDNDCFKEEDGSDQCQRILDILIQIFLGSKLFTPLQIGAFFAFFARLAIDLQDKLVIQEDRLHKLLEKVICDCNPTSIGASLFEEREQLLLQLLQCKFYERIIDRQKVLEWALKGRFLLICEYVYWRNREFDKLFDCYIQDDFKNVEVFELLGRILKTGDLTKSESLSLKSRIVKALPNLIQINCKCLALLILDDLPAIFSNLLLIDKNDNTLTLLKEIASLRFSRECPQFCDDSVVAQKLFVRLVELCCVHLQEPYRSQYLLDLLKKFPYHCNENDDILKLCRQNKLTTCVVHLLEKKGQFEEAFSLLIQELKESMDLAVNNLEDTEKLLRLVDVGRNAISFCERCVSVNQDQKSTFWLSLLDNLLMVPQRVVEKAKGFGHLITQAVHSMVTVIKTDHVIDRVFEHPAFCKATYSEHQTLIDSILQSYDYEQVLYSQVVSVIQGDGFNEFARGRGAAAKGLMSTKFNEHCASCGRILLDGLHPSVVIAFSCNHSHHVECLQNKHSFLAGKEGTQEWQCWNCVKGVKPEKNAWNRNKNRKIRSESIVNAPVILKPSTSSQMLRSLLNTTDNSSSNIFLKDTFDLRLAPPKNLT